MASLAKWCILGLLILTVGTRADDDEHEDDKKAALKKGCITVTLKSTKTKVDRAAIKDAEGHPADIISMTVVKLLSEEKCEEDYTYFIHESSVIAKKGCSAKFRVCYRTTNQPLPTPESGCKTVRLLSRLNREVEQTLEGRVLTMKIVQQHEEGERCKAGENYGFKGKIVWADKGCRADFLVCFKGTPRAGGEEDDDDEDEDDDGELCKEIVLRSNKKGRSSHRVKDSQGKSVEINSVRVIDQISKVDCEESENFNFNESFVTVWDGCSAKFKVCYDRTEPKPTAEPKPGCITVRLISSEKDDAKKKIPYEQGTVRSMTVQNQESRIKCVKNTNYGYKKNELYAKDGCGADFKVCLKKPVTSTKPPSKRCIQVTLESTGRNDPDWKRLTNRNGDPAQIQSCTLLEEISDNVCEEGKTFFLSGPKINVVDGCRAVFLICYL